jgi:CcmD family protein
MDIRNFQFLCYGLGAAWLIVIVYILVLAQRSRNIRLELDRLKRMVDEGEMKR